jgi:hypothetical protein
MDATKLALLEKTYPVEVVAAFVALSSGIVPSKVFVDLYEAGQQSVVEDPQRFGLEGRPC